MKVLASAGTKVGKSCTVCNDCFKCATYGGPLATKGSRGIGFLSEGVYLDVEDQGGVADFPVPPVVPAPPTDWPEDVVVNEGRREVPEGLDLPLDPNLVPPVAVDVDLEANPDHPPIDPNFDDID